jgi:hypothetical protein
VTPLQVSSGFGSICRHYALGLPMQGRRRNLRAQL